MKSNRGRLIPGEPFNLNCLMKKIIKSMAVLMAAAAALTACKAELTESLESMQGVSFSIEEMDDPVTDETSDLDEPETRTVFGNPSNKTIPVLWTANQGVSVFAESSAVSSARDWSVVPSKDGKTAKLTGSAMNLSGFSNGYFVLLSPSASFASHTAGNTHAMVTVPATQIPTATSPDEKAMILGAKTDTYASAPTTVKFTPKHMTAYLALKLTNSKVKGVQSVTVEFTAKGSTFPLTGGAKFDYSGTTPKITSASVSGNTTVTARVSSLTNVVWLAVLPAKVAGAFMKVTIAGTSGTETRSIRVPSGKNLTPGTVATVTVDMNPTTTVPVTGVTVSPTTLTLSQGKTATLTATVSPSTATDKTVTWTSSNTGVATVSSDGVVTGVKAGTATITATTNDGGKTATCEVTVKKVVSYLTLLTKQDGVEPLYDDDALHITPAKSATLQYKIVYTDGSTSTNNGAIITIKSGSGVSLSGRTLSCTSVGQTAKVEVAALDPALGVATGHNAEITVKTWSDPTSVVWSFNVPLASGARWCKTGETYGVTGTVYPSTARQKVVLEAREKKDYWVLTRSSDTKYSMMAPAFSASDYRDYINKISVLRLSAWHDSSVYSEYSINVSNIDVLKPKLFDFIVYNESTNKYRIIDGGLRISGTGDDFYCSNVSLSVPSGFKVVGIVTYYPENPIITNPYPMYSRGVCNLEVTSEIIGPDGTTTLPAKQFHGFAIALYNAGSGKWSADNDDVDGNANWSQELGSDDYPSKTQWLDSQQNNGFMLMIAARQYNVWRGGSHEIRPANRVWEYTEPGVLFQCLPFPKTNPSLTFTMRPWFVPTVKNWYDLSANGKLYNTRRMNKINEQINKAGGEQVFSLQSDQYWTINTATNNRHAYYVNSEGSDTRAKSDECVVRPFMIF